MAATNVDLYNDIGMDLYIAVASSMMPARTRTCYLLLLEACRPGRTWRLFALYM